ncbi:hypothetical protein ScPMuIL_004930 [Solemya velum]
MFRKVTNSKSVSGVSPLKIVLTVRIGLINGRSGYVRRVDVCIVKRTATENHRSGCSHSQHRRKILNRGKDGNSWLDVNLLLTRPKVAKCGPHRKILEYVVCIS